MKTFEIRSRGLETIHGILDWNGDTIPRQGEYVFMKGKTREVLQIIYDFDLSKVVCIVE